MFRPLLAVCLTCQVAPADGIALFNDTSGPVTVRILHPAKPEVPAAVYTLAAHEARLLPVGRQPVIELNGNPPQRFRLEPHFAYMFSPGKGGPEFHGIDLAGAMPRANDVPVEPVTDKPLTLKVGLYADDATVLTREAWERRYRERVKAASAVLEKQCGVALEVAAVGDWKSDPAAADLGQQLKAFEKAVSPPPGVLALGLTGRVPKVEGKPVELPACVAREPLWPHVLVRTAGLSELEQVEAVVAAVAHHLGAARSSDTRSAVHGRIEDGRRAVGRNPVGLDPINLLAVGVWRDAVRGGKVKSFADLQPADRERLAVVYKTLSGLLPGDELAADHLAALERTGEVAKRPEVQPPQVDPPMPKPAVSPAEPKPLPKLPPLPDPTPKAEKPPEPPKPVLPEMPKPAVPEAPKVVVTSETPKAVEPAPASLSRAEAVRKVLQAIRLRAADLRRDPDSDKSKGDALTAELFLAAADITYRMDDPTRAQAFLIGIGLGLDDSMILRGNPLFAGLARTAETDAERQERIAALGTPTLRGRRDLCQHFVVSAALTAVAGPTAAEKLGLLKELADRDGVSGFSFADLAADIAGITFAQSLQKFPEAIGRFANGVNLDDYMPPISGLKEGLTAAKFKEQFGDTSDPRFTTELGVVRARVLVLPKYREIADFNPPKR